MTRDPSARSATTPSPWLVLGAALIGISFAAPLIRLSNADPLVIATWRLGFSLIIVAAALLITGGWRAWRTLAARDLMLATGAGILLAVHFWSWNASLRFTSVAASVALVNLQPVFIAAASAWWLDEVPSRRQWGGVSIAVVGALVVGLADIPGGLSGIGAAIFSGGAGDGSGGGSRALFGDLLALLGAVTAAGYYLIGRRLRKQLDVWSYVGLVYSAAFATCLVLALGTGKVIGPQPPRELAIFAGLALGPMLLGHTGMNWALGHLPAFVVNLTTLGEPIGATILAAILPGIAEVPGVGTIVGGALVLGGVLLAARR
ncbi:MAG: DMT family transporter [Gemmatimonadaceae bacterium]|nr:DMT family transporter [Gemmatimonadaceae bacterium]